ncbi:MAG: dihydrofolate reductase family protein [Clostridia bacterium]|nr:dihydrofolate reductase family protein [Clostridia bacterium]
MNRPYIICHMVTSLDGKVTGDFLSTPECADACEIYYDINRNLKSNGFICGRVTMEGSFTGGYYPDLSRYEPVHHDMDLKMDFILDDMSGFYAVAFDPKGKLGWESNKIIDPDVDPGYNGAQIIEVLTEQVDARYLGYLKSMEIPYIFAGKTEIDVEFALFKLKNIIGCETLLLEGGSIVNGFFQRADAIDELSLIVAPVVAEKDDKPLFADSALSNFEIVNAKIENNVVVLNYLKKGERASNNNVVIKWEDALTLDEAIKSEKSE